MQLSTFYEAPSLAPFLSTLHVEERATGSSLEINEALVEEVLFKVIQNYARSFGFEHVNHRAITSLWSRWFFGISLPPLLAALIVLGKLPPLDRVMLDENSQPYGIRWRDTEWFKTVSDTEEEVTVDGLLYQFEPVINTLSHGAKLSLNVLWNNFGNLLEFWLQRLKDCTLARADMLTAFEVLLESRSLNKSIKNPVYMPVRYVIDARQSSITKRIRRVCCLVYLQNDLEQCENCPRSQLWNDVCLSSEMSR